MYLEKLQEVRLGGAGFPNHCHGRAEIIHIFPVGV